MQKLYLFKSDHEREKIGDVIIDLNAIRCIKCVDAKDMLCILVEFDDDHGWLLLCMLLVQWSYYSTQ